MKKRTTQNPLFKGGIMLLTKVFLVGIFLVSQLGAFAQTKEVSGTVIGQDSKPIPGLTVIVKGTTTGAITDFEKFRIGIKIVGIKVDHHALLA